MSDTLPDLGRTDLVELKLGKTVRELDYRALFSYYQEMNKLVHGHPLPVDQVREQAILKWLRNTYKEDAGDMLKYIFHVKRGVVDGVPVMLSVFSSGHKWWVDQLWHEMREYRDRLSKKKDTPETLSGFGSFEDL